MELKKLKCNQCETVADVHLLPGQAIYRCKSCGKLTRVVESEEKKAKPKRKRKTKNG